MENVIAYLRFDDSELRALLEETLNRDVDPNVPVHLAGIHALRPVFAGWWAYGQGSFGMDVCPRITAPTGNIDTTAMISDPQRRHIFALCGELRMRERDDRLDYVSKVLGREIGSFNELTFQEASTIILSLKGIGWVQLLLLTRGAGSADDRGAA